MRHCRGTRGGVKKGQGNDAFALDMEQSMGIIKNIRLFEALGFISEEKELEMKETLQDIRERRSCRKFDGRQIEEEQLNALRNTCAGKLTSLIDLIRGDLSDDVMQLICDPSFGLFPRYSELKPSCDCLDDAVLCRHAAAALYAIAPRLDEQPELFFTLRGIDPESFFALETVAGTEMESDLTAEDLSATFGIEIDL